MPPIIGIDLGTTNTAVAVLQDGRPRIIEDDRGYRVLPSVVSAKGEGRFVVGQAAHALILTQPKRTVYATKRLLGRRFDSPEVQRVRARIGYALREAPDGGVQMQVGDAWMTPSEVAAVVLQVVRGIADKALGEPVEEAVITVPAHFNHAQRKATMEAAEIAGLRCNRLLNEPTAAALAYGHRRNVDRVLVVFDLGGGTFDVSVLRLSKGLYEILATKGDTFLGGEDFDYRVTDHLADCFKAVHGVDLREDRAVLQRLKDAAERVKCELSFADSATVIVPHVLPGKNLEVVVTRVQLEALTRDLVEKCARVTREAVAEAGITLSEVDEVILVGGQTRMPLVREAVAGLVGREPSRSVHPEEAVAIGAAVHAASLGDVEAAPAVLLDVTPFDLGIEAAGGQFSRVVSRNARIPCSETRTFSTLHDNQTTVKLTVRQGESRLAQENEFLGEFSFEGLPPAPRMQTKVAVTFRIDPNGMLHVSATEPGSGAERHISIRHYSQKDRSVVADPGEQVSKPRSTKAAPGAAVKDAGVKAKVGFFESLFGKAAGIAAGKPAEKPAVKTATNTAPTSPERQPEASVAGLAEPVGPLVEPLVEPLEEAAPLDAEALQEIEPEVFALPPSPAEVEEDDLYADSLRSLATPSAAAAPSGLDAADLFGDPLEDDGDAPTASGARLPSVPAIDVGIENLVVPARAEAFEDDPFAFSFADLVGDIAADSAAPIASAPIASAPIAAATSTRPTQALVESDLAEGTKPARVPKAKKPAKVKLSFADRGTLVAEYRENVSRGGALIRTGRPLAVGRECLFEVTAPDFALPVAIPARVVRVVAGGMEVVYELSDAERHALEGALRG